jgi:hypothetical protein
VSYTVHEKYPSELDELLGVNGFRKVWSFAERKSIEREFEDGFDERFLTMAPYTLSENEWQCKYPSSSSEDSIDRVTERGLKPASIGGGIVPPRIRQYNRFEPEYPSELDRLLGVNCGVSPSSSRTSTSTSSTTRPTTSWIRRTFRKMHGG